jgi:hypothetical protein
VPFLLELGRVTWRVINYCSSVYRANVSARL